ncbi:hypothetical protein [Burkholderia contaminans]|uniref:Uncharacterized protein n=1 Tax=Burkholderia contaminans TaxID=488447 RepID=A0A3N8PET7_9BURK|nr:hypothetical protein [Burkholderia contaminans]RQT09798.1 hypothetical protein DF051_29380 [Burkholderia contaminans]
MQHETKIVKVADVMRDKVIDAELLAKTAKTIGGVRFTFLVTRVLGKSYAAVTESKSGGKAAKITTHSLEVCKGDYRKAAQREIGLLIQRHGEDRVRAVLEFGGKPT